MSESSRMWMEIIFNIAYLTVIWGVVVAMIRHLPDVKPQNEAVAKLFILAFGLLALGDTGHVGFRVWAYASGGLDTSISIGSLSLGLVGAGALATAVTVTGFYVVLLFIWKARYQKSLGVFGVLLLLAATIRLLIMIPAANEWNNSVPPQPWSLYRNLPLVILGLGVAYLMLRDAHRTHDKPFTWIGIMILLSYAFYAPVILLVQQTPMIGMLMIPKTLAYVAIAFIAYGALFRQSTPHPVQQT